MEAAFWKSVKQIQVQKANWTSAWNASRVGQAGRQLSSYTSENVLATRVHQRPAQVKRVHRLNRWSSIQNAGIKYGALTLKRSTCQWKAPQKLRATLESEPFFRALKFRGSQFEILKGHKEL